MIWFNIKMSKTPIVLYALNFSGWVTECTPNRGRSFPHCQWLARASVPRWLRVTESGWRHAAPGRWMPDVVRQLVGIGMVPWHVINLTGLQRAMPQGERLHVNTTHHPCYRWPGLWLSSDDSTWFSRLCIGKTNIWPNMRLCSVPLV
jgi:hypothetical protein